MMNYIWGFLILCGFGAFALSGDPAASVDAMLCGVSEALELCLALCPSFMLWLGLMNVAREAGLMEKLSRAARPLLKRLMPDSSEAMAPITLNLAANFLGLGSAATPFGIEAMAELQKANRLGNAASDDMCMFIALNSSAVELLPTSVLALRAAAGSTDPYCVVLEVKYNGFLLDYLRELINSVDRSELSVSKYVLARQNGCQTRL